MNRRQDALAAAAKDVLAVREVVRAEKGTQVGNVGFVRVEPGAINVVPGRVEFPVEIRDLDDAKFIRMWNTAQKKFQETDAAENVTTVCTATDDTKPARANPELQAAIREAAQSAGLATMDIPSFAGQDAQELATIAPMAMIFVPSKMASAIPPKNLLPRKTSPTAPKPYTEPSCSSINASITHLKQ